MCTHTILPRIKGDRRVPRPSDIQIFALSTDQTGFLQDGYPILFASEESLQDVAKTIRLAAQGETNPIGRIGGLDQARWKDTSVEIERFIFRMCL